jgi:uncharacterized membrane protein YkvA (DUF1232 family)
MTVPGWLLPALAFLLGVLIAITALGLAAAREPAVREAFGRLRRLPNRQKVGFVRALAFDRRLRFGVRAIPWALAAYLLLPFDIVPDFIPFLGQLDDVAIVALALWAMVRLVPRALFEEHLAGAEVLAEARGVAEDAGDSR